MGSKEIQREERMWRGEAGEVSFQHRQTTRGKLSSS